MGIGIGCMIAFTVIRWIFKVNYKDEFDGEDTSEMH